MKNTTPTRKVLRSAVPVRFSEGDDAILTELHERTGLPKADIVRRSLRYGGPRFLRGEVSITDFSERPSKRKAA